MSRVGPGFTEPANSGVTQLYRLFGLRYLIINWETGQQNKDLGRAAWAYKSQDKLREHTGGFGIDLLARATIAYGRSISALRDISV